MRFQGSPVTQHQQFLQQVINWRSPRAKVQAGDQDHLGENGGYLCSLVHGKGCLLIRVEILIVLV